MRINKLFLLLIPVCLLLGCPSSKVDERVDRQFAEEDGNVTAVGFASGGEFYEFPIVTEINKTAAACKALARKTLPRTWLAISALGACIDATCDRIGCQNEGCGNLENLKQLEDAACPSSSTKGCRQLPCN